MSCTYMASKAAQMGQRAMDKTIFWCSSPLYARFCSGHKEESFIAHTGGQRSHRGTSTRCHRGVLFWGRRSNEAPPKRRLVRQCRDACTCGRHVWCGGHHSLMAPMSSLFTPLQIMWCHTQTRSSLFETAGDEHCSKPQRSERAELLSWA